MTSNEMTKLQATPIYIKTGEVEVDGISHGPQAYQVGYHDIITTVLSFFVRLIALNINIKLALSYFDNSNYNYFVWTTATIVVPMFVTMLIHANMCHQDGKFSQGILKALKTLFMVLLSCCFFRYCQSLVYSWKCKNAQRRGDIEEQKRYYKLTIREESDVAFIRLFECFLEAAPQKVLQISIVLGHVDEITTMQIIAICSYFGSMAWCLAVYHRSNRISQNDKYNISQIGIILQLFWHFCTAVSRTLCLAFVASLFPLWTLCGCLMHSFLLGSITFILDQPHFCKHQFLNLLFCLIMGIVYLFTYIAVKEEPTKLKYILYYILCSLENIACVYVFISFASNDLTSVAYLFYTLCAMSLIFYIFGIVFMIIYYKYFHPRITSRKHICVPPNVNQGVGGN